MCLLREALEGFMRFSVRGYLSSALLGALLVAQSLALLVPTIAGGKGGVPPPSPGLPVLSSVSFTPAIVPGGSPATGTVKFGSVTDGAQSSRCSTVIRPSSPSPPRRSSTGGNRAAPSR